MKKLLLIAALLASVSLSYAADNTVTLTPGSGVTMRTQDVGSGVQSPYNILGNTSGTSIYGTAGTSNTAVLSVQGIASGTALPVSLTSTTITGTVAATQSGTWTVQPGNTANTTAWLVTGTGGTFPVTATNLSTNIAQINGVTPLMGNGVTGTGSPRVTLVSDGTAISTAGYMSVKIDQTTVGTTNAISLAQINAATTLAGNGATGTGAQRVTIANDNTLPTGWASSVAIASTTSGQTGPLAQCAVTTSAPTYTTAQTDPLSCDTSGSLRTTVVNANANGQATMANSSPVVIASNQSTLPVAATPYPATAVPYTATATGTTGATTATLAGAVSVTTYLCGFSIRANATAAATGNATVTGVITATLNFTQWTAPNASGIGITEMIFAPCIPASGTNQSVAVVSAAPGTGGVVSVTAWGYKL